MHTPAHKRLPKRLPKRLRECYDIFAELLHLCVTDPAKLLNEYGDVVTDIGNASMDDAATSTQTEGGAVRVLEISGDFFEFMNGKLNMMKTLVAILMHASKGQLKRKAQPGEVWSAEHHIPDKILVVNN